MSKIIGYGELMLRLTPVSENPNKKNIINYYSSTFAGCEANSLIFLARRGHNCEFLSAFPKNKLGLTAEKYLTSNNLKCNLKYDDNRLGTFFTESGIDNNSFTKILYDRKNSSFSKYNLSEKLINTLFKGYSFLIISGITPALSKICYKNIIKLIEIAKTNNIKIVYDVNYRKDLWSIEACKNFNLKILSEVDYLFTSSGSIRQILDFDKNQNNDSFFSDTEFSAKYLYEKFNIEFIGMTVRNNNSLSGCIFNDNNFYKGEIYELDQIDRVGAGDSFLGACLHGIIKKWGMNKIVSFATSTFASSHTISGDLNYLDDDEIYNFKRINSN